MGRRLAVIVLSMVLLAAQAAADPPHGGGHYAHGRHAWVPHEPWRHDLRRFDHDRWHGGHWWHGTYAGRLGWWWIVGPDWYWYPAPIHPYPDPYVPPGLAAGTWYWCDAYQQYYPYVGACPAPWRAVPPG